MTTKTTYTNAEGLELTITAITYGDGSGSVAQITGNEGQFTKTLWKRWSTAQQAIEAAARWIDKNA